MYIHGFISIFYSHEMINKFPNQQVSSLRGYFSFDKASTLHEKYIEELLMDQLCVTPNWLIANHQVAFASYAPQNQSV